MADMQDDERIVANPGSTLGEAVGALIEVEVKRLLKPIAEAHGYAFVAVGPTDPRTGKTRKLTLKDNAGNAYQIDCVIANERMQPLILIESKYIRYTKHNRDKGSWVCTAHYSLRRTFPSIRKSIAVIAGSWSKSSKALMQSFDVTLFEVGFPHIVETLLEYGIDFAWGEKERHKAVEAWEVWRNLTTSQYDEIAKKLLAAIEPALQSVLSTTLSSATPREIQDIEVALETNLGEKRVYSFSSIADAIEFLEAFDTNDVLNDVDSPTLWSIDT